MEASHAASNDHQHTHEHRENWHDDEFAQKWIDGQAARETERRAQFVKIRAVIPKNPDQEFSYVNIGAGAGHLDEILLEHFKGAQATLVDVSLAMLEASRERLKRFGDRVEYVQADLATPDWAAAVGGPFDVAVSSIAIHNLRDPERIRAVYAETFKILGHGGMFLNLDYMKPGAESLGDLTAWAAKDPEAGFYGRGGARHPGTVAEQLGWLTEAGFPIVDVLWKDLRAALLCGVRDHLHLPEASAHSHSHGHDEHSHSHGDELHSHDGGEHTHSH